MALRFSRYSLVWPPSRPVIRCHLCIALYAVNLLLFFSWIVRRRFAPSLFSRPWKGPASLPRALNALILRAYWRPLRGQAAYPAYWLFQSGADAAQIAGVTRRPALDRCGEPRIEIIEFADYQCSVQKNVSPYQKQCKIP
jgi:hypothetical protein